LKSVLFRAGAAAAAAAAHVFVKREGQRAVLRLRGSGCTLLLRRAATNGTFTLPTHNGKLATITTAVLVF